MHQLNCQMFDTTQLLCPPHSLRHRRRRSASGFNSRTLTRTQKQRLSISKRTQESHQFREMVSGYRAWCTQHALHGHVCLAPAFQLSWDFVSELCLNEHVRDLGDNTILEDTQTRENRSSCAQAPHPRLKRFQPCKEISRSKCLVKLPRHRIVSSHLRGSCRETNSVFLRMYHHSSPTVDIFRRDCVFGLFPLPYMDNLLKPS